jgi:hypothetical protein
VPKKIRGDVAVYSFTQGLMGATAAVSNSPITDPVKRRKGKKRKKKKGGKRKRKKGHLNQILDT